VAPDISSLKKPAGDRCPHLDAEHRCTMYHDRPAVCRGYQPDELCLQVAAPTLAERVKRYLALFT
jgi:Fe-S-cluster containining protein